MNRIILGVVFVSACFVTGCGSDDKDVTDVQIVQEDPLPTLDKYRKLLEIRSQSSGGADLDIRKLCARFEAASASEKRELYQRAINLMR